ncbi:MAG TPA: hypothetical protein VNL69_00525 [Bacteroidota bacterium]|nr:hypothetical protein [Bacteroidota bacterium]
MSGCAAALGALTSPTAGQLQQKIAAKVVLDQMESEAEMTRKIVQSGSELAASARTGTRVDFRA